MKVHPVQIEANSADNNMGLWLRIPCCMPHSRLTLVLWRLDSGTPQI